MPLANLNNVCLRYQFAGNQDGPVLVLSNSLGTGIELWDPQLEILGQRFHLLRYDTRGHGASSVPGGEYKLEDLGCDVLQLLDHLGIDRASVCGISLGGITALWLAIHAPARIESIVAADTGAKIGTADGWAQRIAFVREKGMASLAQGTSQRWFTAPFLKSNQAHTSQILTALAATSPDGYVSCCAALRDADLRARVAEISLPALVICGTHDVATTLADAQFLNQNIRGSQLVELNAAHLSNVEAASAFNKASMSFFNSVEIG